MFSVRTTEKRIEINTVVVLSVGEKYKFASRHDVWQSFDQVKTWWRIQNGENASLISETTAIQIFENGSVEDKLRSGRLSTTNHEKNVNII